MFPLYLMKTSFLRTCHSILDRKRSHDCPCTADSTEHRTYLLLWIKLFFKKRSVYVESEFFPLNSSLRWLRELNAMQIKKTHANRKKQIKLTTHSLQKVTTQHKYRNDNNGTKQRTTTSIDEGVFWACLCCEFLQRVASCFLNLQCVELSGPPYLRAPHIFPWPRSIGVKE